MSPLRQFRRFADITIKRLATASGVSTATICHIETGKTQMSDETAKKLLDGYRELGFDASSAFLAYQLGTNKYSVSLNISPIEQGSAA